MQKRLSTKSGSLLAPRLAAAFAGALALGASATASASPAYPAALEDFFALTAEPTCALCHNDSDGGSGQINNFVGMYVRYDLGLEGGAGEDAIKKALFRWSPRHDADEDGTPDLEELKGGTNPNAQGTEPEEEPKEETPDEEEGAAGAAGAELKKESGYRMRPGQKMGGCSYADVATEGGARDVGFLAIAILARRFLTKRRSKRA